MTQPLPLPQGVSDAAVGAMALGDEPGLGWVFALALLGCLAVAFAQKPIAKPEPRS